MNNRRSMNLKYYLKKIKDVGINEYLSIIPMLLGVLLIPFYKNKYKNVWLISEREGEARDNGYHFFKYMRENHKNEKCVYAIKKKCSDYEKVKNLGEVVEYGGLKHWILYFTCKFIISSQGGKPAAYLCTALERSGLYHPRNIFLQHGITKDRAEWLYAEHLKVDYFITGAEPETEFVRKYLGYKNEAVQLTGFARFDALHDFEIQKKQIFIMPTWRKWLKLPSEEHYDATRDIETSEYVECWSGLLKSSRMQEIIKKYDLNIIFHIHPHMKKIVDVATLVGENITYTDAETVDLQGLLKSSELLITDYSSVFFDMAYMKKPIIFYQFDEKKYRKYHYQQGWFDYHNTSFGKLCSSYEEVLDEIEKAISNNFSVTEQFLNEHNEIFPLYDKNNCMRIYTLLKNI